jgi:CRP/FNR family transcriptional regulator, cyclic AMP receptor protein
MRKETAIATPSRAMIKKLAPPSRTDILLADAGTSSRYAERKTIYAQGAASGAIFFIQSGIVLLTVRSKGRRPAVIRVISAGGFFNESCLAKGLFHLSTATTLVASSILMIQKKEMVRLLHDELKIAALYESQLLVSNMRFREDLVDVLVNSASQRLARALLRLANINGTGAARKATIPRISQSALAAMVGTTRSRVNFFMNQFRKKGFISYNGTLEVRSSLRRALAKA